MWCGLERGIGRAGKSVPRHSVWRSAGIGCRAPDRGGRLELGGWKGVVIRRPDYSVEDCWEEGEDEGADDEEGCEWGDGSRVAWHVVWLGWGLRVFFGGVVLEVAR